jgi:hypothetical protein
MGILDTLLGRSQADASNRAASDTYGKQIAAGDKSAARFDELAAMFDTYRTGGSQAQKLLYDLLGLSGADAQSEGFSRFREDPGTEYLRSEAMKGVERSAAARGSLNSGATLKALQDRSANIADQSYGTWLQRLMALGGQGFDATKAAVGTSAQGAQNDFTSEYGAAPTIGQGWVAGEQAKSDALSNLLKTAGFVGGSYFGGNTGRTSSYSPTTVYGSAGGYGVPTFPR